MLKSQSHLLLFLFLLPATVLGQDIDTGPGYQMAIMNNPAFSGSEGDDMLKLSYLNFYPGNNYNLHSVYLSYDSFFPVLHGGAGLYLSDEYLGGIINDLRAGLSYAYFLKAGEDFYINAGLSASVIHRGFNFNGAVLPDQIDPSGGISLPPGEVLSAEGQTLFDIGAGFVFIADKIHGGLSVNHLAEPDFSASGFTEEKLNRKFMFNIAGDINLGKQGDFLLRPLGYMVLQGEVFYAGAGATIENQNFSINGVVIGDNANNTDIQTGFTIGTGNIRFYYNYRFNIASVNKSMPLSMFHQAGIAFSLNNVDKRNIIKTINFPKL